MLAISNFWLSLKKNGFSKVVPNFFSILLNDKLVESFSPFLKTFLFSHPAVMPAPKSVL